MSLSTRGGFPLPSEGPCRCGDGMLRKLSHATRLRLHIPNGWAFIQGGAHVPLRLPWRVTSTESFHRKTVLGCRGTEEQTVFFDATAVSIIFSISTSANQVLLDQASITMASAKASEPKQEHESLSSQEPPQYFDSEPSSQPPSYGKIASKNNAPQRSSGPASAASIAAVLGPPPEKGPKRTWADRWSDLKSGNKYGGKYNPDMDTGASCSKWNSQGVKLGDPKKWKK